MREIPLSVPNLSAEITDNLRECIETGWVSTGGRFIGEFEKKVADYAGVADAVSTQSGTAGLHLALQVLGVRPGDEIIVPTLTFIAAVNSVKYVGAEPVFMDCDDSLCIDPVKLEQFCRSECNLEGGYLYHSTTGKRIPALILVHVFG
ncbi:MAG: LegC family aminotransferase, partial [Bacillota bacterium]|nr:LegC family aminotransferase [Bacillota bacterium]